MVNEMTREEAIEHCDKYDQIEGKRKFSKKDEAKIKTVMKQGKIYGDPICFVKG